jgi:hypothetical protein
MCQPHGPRGPTPLHPKLGISSQLQKPLYWKKTACQAENLQRYNPPSGSCSHNNHGRGTNLYKMQRISTLLFSKKYKLFKNI